MTSWHQRASGFRLSVMLISDLCALLTPILLYSPCSISSALINEDRLLSTIPRAILMLLRSGANKVEQIDTCIRFYTKFVQSKYKQSDSSDDTDDEKESETSKVITSDSVTNPLASLSLTKDLISSYYNLYQQFQTSVSLDEKLTQQEQIQNLFNTEWKKIDTLQLKHDYDQLKQAHQSVNEELGQLRSELQRSQLEQNRLRKENLQLNQHIDRLKLGISTAVTISSDVLTQVLAKNNTNDQEDIISQLQNLSPHEITAKQAEQCIREIYHRRTTFDDHDMRKSICGSLKHLGSDLYSSSVHFLHELIQNAEDNIYDCAIIPCLRIELNHDYILLSNNEQGLRAPDVLAICSLAVSTKTIEQKHIGEKGVGFKSVFAASNQPMLISHAWKFCFQVPGVDAMSYITPLWIDNIPECISSQVSNYSQNTHLYLPLKLSAHTLAADQFLNDVARAVDPCILLNMRQLEKLELVDRRQEKFIIIKKQVIGSTKLDIQPNVIFEDCTFMNLSGSINQLCTLTGYNTFRVYTCHIDVPSSIEQRRTPTTSLIMAFPCENDYCLTGNVYTGLPVCDLGFNFIFNADFHLVTSRENVRENVPFNVYLRDNLAVLFVYLLLNDPDLRKDISRYYPSSNTHQVKHSSWWLIMIDRINSLITKYLSILFDIGTGKLIRHVNSELTSLISNEQLYNCANIQVIDSSDSFLTMERLKSFQIQSVSIKDVLECFPNRDDTMNEFRQEFRLWTQKQDERWWSQFFNHLSKAMTPEISITMLYKSIFILHDDPKRQYLPTMNDASLLLFINDHPSMRMWKRQITLLRCISQYERIALLHSNKVQLLTENRLIEIILHHHLQLALSLTITSVNTELIDELWQDLLYLRSRLDKFDKSASLLVPINGASSFTLIQNAILPTIFGVDIRSFIPSITSPVIYYPYYGTHESHLINDLQWEYFFLEMNCQRSSIQLPKDYKIDQLPLLPSFTKLTDEKWTQLSELILLAQTQTTRECLRQFPIVSESNTEQQISPISATFDETMVTDLLSLPRIIVPSYCRSLASKFGVCAEYDLRTCVTILQLLSDEKNTNIDLYIQWLGRLQLNVRQQYDTIDPTSLLSSCQLYLPDQKQFHSLKDLLVMSDNDQHRQAILLVCKYRKLQLISPSINQTYWQFKDLFRMLGCQCVVSISDIYSTIYSARHDKNNFYDLGDGQTILTENGMEAMITLFQYFEILIMICVTEHAVDTDLYRAIVTNKHKKAPCGSREDLEWRFSFTCNELSTQLKKLTGTQYQYKTIFLLTIDRKLISTRSANVIYACLETKIIQNLSRDFDKRYFISPVIARTCPLVLAAFEIDYVERRGKVKWIHKNHNLELHLDQLSQIFQNALDDRQLEVVIARYASTNLYLSDTFVIDSINDENNELIDSYIMETDYPFWVFDKTVLLCAGNAKKVASTAIKATSALTTLLHKRKHIPFEEAKTIARQKISECNAFQSELISSVTSTSSMIYSYLDLVFPTDHHSIESMTISIGRHCTVEHDPEENTSPTIAADRMGEDRIYRKRAQTQNHRCQNERSSSNWMDPKIVDSAEQIRIGHNGEHFFFVYLQKLYGTADVTPIQNWRSSSRLVVYPQYTRNVDDSVGYDFELHDTQEQFVRGTGSTTKICYFEVKSTSGSFDKVHTQFHISQNEFERCQAIANDAQRREREAYFIVIIENCLDSEKIALGSIINWSNCLNIVKMVVNSYQCSIVSPSATNLNRTNNNTAESATVDHRQNQERQQSMRPYDNNQNSMLQSARSNNEASSSNRNHPPSQWNQQQQTRQFHGRGRGWNRNSQHPTT
ncbi:unnamed protein product [Rotaria sp. Silwood1]|nr:unnamed protein product [Rotaria sp. Silwood1]